MSVADRVAEPTVDETISKVTTPPAVLPAFAAVIVSLEPRLEVRLTDLILVIIFESASRKITVAVAVEIPLFDMVLGERLRLDVEAETLPGAKVTLDPVRLIGFVMVRVFVSATLEAKVQVETPPEFVGEHKP